MSDFITIKVKNRVREALREVSDISQENFSDILLRLLEPEVSRVKPIAKKVKEVRAEYKVHSDK